MWATCAALSLRELCVSFGEIGLRKRSQMLEPDLLRGTRPAASGLPRTPTMGLPWL